MSSAVHLRGPTSCKCATSRSSMSLFRAYGNFSRAWRADEPLCRCSGTTLPRLRHDMRVGKKFRFRHAVWVGGRSPSEIQGPRSKARARWYSYNQGPRPRPRAVIQNSDGRTLHAWRRRLTAVSVLPASLQATTHSSTRSNGLATCTKVCLLARSGEFE